MVEKLALPCTRGPGTEFYRTVGVRLKVGIRSGKPFVLGVEGPGEAWRLEDRGAGVGVKGAWQEWAKHAVCPTLKQREGGGDFMKGLMLCSLRD